MSAAATATAGDILPSKAKIFQYVQKNPLGSALAVAAVVTVSIVSSASYATALRNQKKAADASLTAEERAAYAAHASKCGVAGALALTATFVGVAGVVAFAWYKGGGAMPRIRRSAKPSPAAPAIPAV